MGLNQCRRCGRPCPGERIPAKYISAGWTVRTHDSADVDMSIRNAIHEEADFVIIFLGREAMKPEWVRKECECVLEREKFLSNFK